MTATDARDLGLLLHELVADLEPAQWTDDKREQLEEAFASFREEVDRVLADWSSSGTLDPVRGKLSEVAEVVARKLPSSDEARVRWMEFRQEIHPAYEGLAEALKSCHMELPSLRPTNYARSLVHALSGVVALLFIEFSPWWLLIAVPFSLAAFFWFLEIARRVSDRWNDALMKILGPIAHPHERYRVNSSTWFATALSVLSLTYEPVAAAAAVLVLGFGDPAAALVGRKYGRTQLVNNRSLEGTLTFAAVSFGVVFGALAIWHTDLSIGIRLAVCGVAAVAGALTELLSRRIDDNFAIPVVTGLAVWALLGLL
jgi:dolichol kinase